MRTPLCKITYIQEHHNIILLGATGSGKTYLACARGMAAARRFYVVKYIWLPDLLVEFQMVILQSSVRNEAKKLKYSLPNRMLQRYAILVTTLKPLFRTIRPPVVPMIF